MILFSSVILSSTDVSSCQGTFQHTAYIYFLLIPTLLPVSHADALCDTSLGRRKRRPGPSGGSDSACIRGRGQRRVRAITVLTWPPRFLTFFRLGSSIYSPQRLLPPHAANPHRIDLRTPQLHPASGLHHSISSVALVISPSPPVDSILRAHA